MEIDVHAVELRQEEGNLRQAKVILRVEVVITIKDTIETIVTITDLIKEIKIDTNVAAKKNIDQVVDIEVKAVVAKVVTQDMSKKRESKKLCLQSLYLPKAKFFQAWGEFTYRLSR
jgi:hypothetical protein